MRLTKANARYLEKDQYAILKKDLFRAEEVAFFVVSSGGSVYFFKIYRDDTFFLRSKQQKKQLPPVETNPFWK